MQLDMHFYGVYALARAAGIKDDVAEKIAFASQFVDDAIDQGVVFVTGKDAILPTMTSHKPIDYQNAIPNDQWQVWVPFHFLPGNEGNEFYERMICRKGSNADSTAMQMLKASLNNGYKNLWPHLIGITAHVFADTFSHYGFIGLCSDNNKVRADSITPDEKHSPTIINYLKAKWDEFTTRFTGGAAEIVPVGHGSVGTFPDRPFLEWKFKYEDASLNTPLLTDRKNHNDYLEACRLLHDYFMQYKAAEQGIADPSGSKAWTDISGMVDTILKKEEPLDVRIDEWKNALANNFFCTATGKDKKISYKDDLWRPRRAGYSVSGGLPNSDTCRFIRAAHRHRDYVLRELLPAIGLITS